VVDLTQVIRPWVVVDVTPPGQAQTAPGSASSPTNIAVGKSTSGVSVQTTSGSYGYDIMCYMNSVVKEQGSGDSGS
jgi:hypothetical protein